MNDTDRCCQSWRGYTACGEQRSGRGLGREQAAEWARCSPEPEQLRPRGPRQAAHGRFWDSAFWWAKPVEERRWSLSAHWELFLMPLPKTSKESTKCREQKKNWLASTQLRDNCAQNRKDMMADSLLHLEKTMHNCYHKRAAPASILPVMFKNGCPTGIQQLAYLQQQACRD